MNVQKYVPTHQRKAPLRGARVRYRAPDALSALGGRDDPKLTSASAKFGDL